MTRAVVSKGGEAGWRVRRQAALSDVDRSGSSCREEPWDGWMGPASRGGTRGEVNSSHLRGIKRFVYSLA